MQQPVAERALLGLRVQVALRVGGGAQALPQLAHPGVHLLELPLQLLVLLRTLVGALELVDKVALAALQLH